jgi:transcriptional regulator with XRE-family HTH domain
VQKPIENDGENTMIRDVLTGTRIRERRIMAGMKQAGLAQQANISASYLNLIEHNRRRIGGKLLLDIAAALDVEPSLLTEGAEAALIAQLRESASIHPKVSAELSRTDEFAGRFPGWAQLLAETHRRVTALERTVVELTDRLTHDPHLADSLHDMLTTVTAIHSTASILAESDDLEPEWRDRFSRNVHEDSARLAEVSQSLVQYLDNSSDANTELQSPQEEMDAVFKAVGPRFSELEDGTQDPLSLTEYLAADISVAAKELMSWALKSYALDVAKLHEKQLASVISELGPDPFKISATLGCSPDLVMRRLAALATNFGLPEVAFAVCDGAGVLIHRQSSARFALPRFGGGCAQLPLYRALTQPYSAQTAWVEPLSNESAPLRAFAYAAPLGPVFPSQPPIYRAYMLVVDPGQDRGSEFDLITQVGVACRICPRKPCNMRQEPSILSSGL